MNRPGVSGELSVWVLWLLCFVVFNAVPRTLNGKKCEVPVEKILASGAR